MGLMPRMGFLINRGGGGHLKLGVRNYGADAMDGYLNKRGEGVSNH